MATSNTGDSHAFAIVEFLDTKEVEIVAFSWTFVDAKNGCMCYWPPYRNANKLKKLCVEQAPPDATWQTYKIRVLYRAVNYAKACTKLPHAEDTSDLCSELSDSETLRPKRKKKTTARFIESDDSGSDMSIEEICVSRHPKERTRKILPAAPKPPPFKKPSLSVSSCPASPASVGGYSITSPSPSPTRPAERVRPEASTSRVGDEGNLITMLKKIMIQQEELKDEVRHNRKMMSVVLAMLKKHEEVIPEMDTLDIRLPVSSIMEFDELEERLKDAAFRKTMVAYLGKAGAVSLDATVKNMLKSCMTDEVASHFNWCGQKMKRGIMKCCIIEVLNAAVRRNATTKSATDNDIKEYAANWLKYANKRQKSKVKETNRMVEDDVVDGELDENEDLLD